MALIRTCHTSLLMTTTRPGHRTVQWLAFVSTRDDNVNIYVISFAASSLSNRHYRIQLRETIFVLRAQGMSYRAIAREVGLHWTRIGQILKAEKSETDDTGL